MMSTPSRLMHSSTIFAPGSFTVASIHLGAPTWPPHSSSEGGYAPLGLPRQRSGRPGAAVAPLDTPTYSTGAPNMAPKLRIRRAFGGRLARAETRLRRAQPRDRNHERRTGHVRHPHLVTELHR